MATTSGVPAAHEATQDGAAPKWANLRQRCLQGPESILICSGHGSHCLVRLYILYMYRQHYTVNFNLAVHMSANRGPQVPASPFSPITALFLDPVDSDLYAFLTEAYALIQKFPCLVEAVEKDLDAHGFRKEAVRIADAQMARAMDLKLDDFKTLLQDSTHVGGNTAWPTDSRLMVDLVARLIRIGEGLNRVRLLPIQCEGIRRRLQKMVRCNREIEFSNGKKDGKRIRRRRYEKLLRMSRRVYALLSPQVFERAET